MKYLRKASEHPSSERAVPQTEDLLPRLLPRLNGSPI
jgi:hypothetical protein